MIDNIRTPKRSEGISDDGSDPRHHRRLIDLSPFDKKGKEYVEQDE